METSTNASSNLEDLDWIQLFYSRHCDGDWEHSFGFDIKNADNPGWIFEFDLEDTKLSIIEFEEINIRRSEYNWIMCRKKDNKFFGSGGVFNLSELIHIFREWVEHNLSSDESVWLK